MNINYSGWAYSSDHKDFDDYLNAKCMMDSPADLDGLTELELAEDLILEAV